MRLRALAAFAILSFSVPSLAGEEKDFTSFSFGPGALLNQDAHDVAYHLAGGYFHQAAGNAGIRVVGHGDFTGDRVNLGAGLGAVAFLPAGELAPFAGADLGFGSAYCGPDGWTSGFALGGSLGVWLFRSSQVQMNIEGRTTVIFADGGDGFPVTLNGSVGLLF